MMDSEITTESLHWAKKIAQVIKCRWWHEGGGSPIKCSCVHSSELGGAFFGGKRKVCHYSFDILNCH